MFKKPDISTNYQFEGFLPDGHFSIGDILHHPQGDAIRFEGNEADIKAISQVPHLINELLQVYADHQTGLINLPKYVIESVRNVLSNVGVEFTTEIRTEPENNLLWESKHRIIPLADVSHIEKHKDTNCSAHRIIIIFKYSTYNTETQSMEPHLFLDDNSGSISFLKQWKKYLKTKNKNEHN